MKYLGFTVVLGVVLMLAGCMAPNSFVRTNEATWGSIEIRGDIDRKAAWEGVVDILVKRFDLEVLSEENGYIRTNWLYTWTNTSASRYRVRVIAKFDSKGNKVDVKSDAEFDNGYGGWIQGTDTRLLATIKSDIMGTIGRTTR